MNDDWIDILLLKQPLLVLNKCQLSFLGPLHGTTLIQPKVTVLLVFVFLLVLLALPSLVVARPRLIISLGALLILLGVGCTLLWLLFRFGLGVLVLTDVDTGNACHLESEVAFEDVLEGVLGLSDEEVVEEDGQEVCPHNSIVANFSIKCESKIENGLEYKW